MDRELLAITPRGSKYLEQLEPQTSKIMEGGPHFSDWLFLVRAEEMGPTEPGEVYRTLMDFEKNYTGIGELRSSARRLFEAGYPK